ncbi:MAG: hypothetical protein JSU87_07125 [Gemmatimonadota bacterium]|nr:MAG: hypothetical protein JSU87_07125 [Gemmatimonadota bacterium]
MDRPATGGVCGGVDAVLHTSVATFYSNLVTRPTGRAVRVAIEEQLREMTGTSLSILDFSRVRIIDYSCADEVIAKLLRRFRSTERPSNVFFVVKGVPENQRDTVEHVLRRDNLLLVAVGHGRSALWGAAPARLRAAWQCLDQLGRTAPEEFASARGVNLRAASSCLRRLVAQRVALPEGRDAFASLLAVADRGPVQRTADIEVRSLGRAAELTAPYGEDPTLSKEDRRARPGGGIDPYLSKPGDLDQLPAR